MKLYKNFGLREAFIILLIAGLSISLVKYFSRQAGVWRTVRIEVTGNNWTNDPYSNSKPPFWMSERIKEGDIELGVDGTEIAKVVKVENYERGDELAEIYLIVKVKTEFNKKLNKFVFKGQAVEIGLPIQLRLNRVFVNGQVIDDQVPKEGYEKKDIIIKGRWKGQEPWKVQQISVGDKMVDRGNNQPVAEILSVWLEPSIKMVGIDPKYSDQLVISSNPRLVDGMVRAKITVEKHDDRWFFAGHQKVKVGRSIWIYLPEIDILGMEIETLEVEN